MKEFSIRLKIQKWRCVYMAEEVKTSKAAEAEIRLEVLQRH